MKIEIFGQAEDTTLRVTLKPTASGVTMVAVDANGKVIPGGMIVSLNIRGLVIHSHVSEDVKLPREDYDRVATKKEG